MGEKEEEVEDVEEVEQMEGKSQVEVPKVKK